VRRLASLAVLAVGLAACGGSGGSKSSLKMTFGLSGGTMMPYSITIAPNRAVTAQGNPPFGKPAGNEDVLVILTSATEAELSGLVQNGVAKLRSEQCPGTSPDESSMFITALGRTVTVRGGCEPGFTTLWGKLARAVGLHQ